jgi:hypothetical protein
MSLKDWLRNGWLTDVINQLDVFRKKRNISDYERAGFISDQEAKEIISLAFKLREELIQWFKRKHPELAPEDGGN